VSVSSNRYLRAKQRLKGSLYSASKSVTGIGCMWASWKAPNLPT